MVGRTMLQESKQIQTNEQDEPYKTKRCSQKWLHFVVMEKVMMIKKQIKDDWMLNPNEKVVNAILSRCEKNNGICPCIHDTEDYEGKDLHCPCTDYLYKDKCCCTLYIKKGNYIQLDPKFSITYIYIKMSSLFLDAHFML